jgi:hypothetical protein
MSILKCRKCLPTNVPDDWTTEKKSEVALLARKMSIVSAIHRFRPVGMDLGDAKNIYMHITREKGFCHHCTTVLVEYEGNCPNCKRLNLDW